MIALPTEFIIDGFVQSDDFRVLGMCGDADIVVGDTFDAVSLYRQRAYPGEMGLPATVELSKPVRLTVTGIHAYQRCLKKLGRGMTGSLTLEGDGLNLIAPGWVLGGGGSK